MNISQAQWLYSVLGIFGLGIAALVLKGERRKLVGNILLAALTVFVGSFLYVGVAGHKVLRSNPTVSADQAELQVRLTSCLEKVIDSTAQKVPIKLGRRSPLESPEEIKERHKAYNRAEEALREVIKQSPQARLGRAKLAILMGVDDPVGNRTAIQTVAAELAALPVDEKQKDQIQFQKLGKALGELYSGKKLSSSDEPRLKQAIEETLPAGWYRDNALLQLYKTTGDTTSAKDLEDIIDSRDLTVFGKIAVIAITMVVAGFVGLINILIQLGLMSRRREEPVDVVGLHVPFKTIYAVFIGWFASYVIMSLGFHFVTAQFPVLSTDPILVACSTAFVYFASNLPGPILIYFLAMRPRDLKFWSSIRVTLNTTTAGPIKLVSFGVLAWCSTIPLIVVSGLIATKLLGTQGSDNPVIGQIVQAASSPNAFAAMLFYFTLGVMAPFFEEILFRGFIYGSLRPKLGAPLSMLLSAALFAIIHFDKGGMLMLFAIGFVLAFTFERTRSLLPSMIAHGMWNSGMFTLALLLFST